MDAFSLWTVFICWASQL